LIQFYTPTKSQARKFSFCRSCQSDKQPPKRKKYLFEKKISDDVG